jgi:hypothetical protein
MFVGGGSKQGDAGQLRPAAGGGRGEERIKPASAQTGKCHRPLASYTGKWKAANARRWKLPRLPNTLKRTLMTSPRRFTSGVESSN